MQTLPETLDFIQFERVGVGAEEKNSSGDKK